jgi:hypothetical protein
MSVMEAILGEAKAATRALMVRRGAELAQEHLPRVARGLAQADASGPTFSTGATAVIAATALAAGGVAGWMLKGFLDDLKGKRR